MQRSKEPPVIVPPREKDRLLSLRSLACGLVSQNLWHSSSFHGFLEVTHFYRSERLQSIVMVMLLMLMVAVTVVTMLLAMLKAMLEGAKSAQGHCALCSVLCQPGWGGDHAPAAWETLDLQSRLQREHSFWKWPAHNASRFIFPVLILMTRLC